jgi:hypothetical protein
VIVDSAAVTNRPYLTVIDPVSREFPDYQQRLESQVVDFINELKARSVIRVTSSRIRLTSRHSRCYPAVY